MKVKSLIFFIKIVVTSNQPKNNVNLSQLNLSTELNWQKIIVREFCDDVLPRISAIVTPLLSRIKNYEKCTSFKNYESIKNFILQQIQLLHDLKKLSEKSVENLDLDEILLSGVKSYISYFVSLYSDENLELIEDLETVSSLLESEMKIEFLKLNEASELFEQVVCVENDESILKVLIMACKEMYFLLEEWKEIFDSAALRTGEPRLRMASDDSGKWKAFIDEVLWKKN